MALTKLALLALLAGAAVAFPSSADYLVPVEEELLQTGCRAEGHNCAAGSCCSGLVCVQTSDGVEPNCMKKTYCATHPSECGQVGCRQSGHRCAAGTCCSSLECVQTSDGAEPECMAQGWCAKNQDLCQGAGGFGKHCINENDPCNAGARSCCGLMICDKVRGRSHNLGHHCVWPEHYERDNCLRNPDMSHCGKGFGHPFAKMWDGTKDIGKGTLNGVKNLGNDTLKLGKDVAKAPIKLGGDTVKFAHHPIQSIVKLRKDIGKETVQLRKDIGKGTVKLGKDTVKGIVNLNKDITKFKKHPFKTTENATKAIGKDTVKLGAALGREAGKLITHPVADVVDAHKELKHTITHPVADVERLAKDVEEMGKMAIDHPLAAAAIVGLSVLSGGSADEAAAVIEADAPGGAVTPGTEVVPETPADLKPTVDPDVDPCAPGSRRRLLGDDVVECIIPDDADPSADEDRFSDIDQNWRQEAANLNPSNAEPDPWEPDHAPQILDSTGDQVEEDNSDAHSSDNDDLSSNTDFDPDWRIEMHRVGSDVSDQRPDSFWRGSRAVSDEDPEKYMTPDNFDDLKSEYQPRYSSGFLGRLVDPDLSDSIVDQVEEDEQPPLNPSNAEPVNREQAVEQAAGERLGFFEKIRRFFRRLFAREPEQPVEEDEIAAQKKTGEAAAARTSVAGTAAGSEVAAADSEVAAAQERAGEAEAARKPAARKAEEALAAQKKAEEAKAAWIEAGNDLITKNNEALAALDEANIDYLEGRRAFWKAEEMSEQDIIDYIDFVLLRGYYIPPTGIPYLP